MSQMLKPTGGQPQGAGYRATAQGHSGLTASTSSSTGSGGKMTPLGLSPSQHYGQLPSAQQQQQQQHHQLLQQQHLQQQQMLQQQQLQQPQQYQQQMPGSEGQAGVSGTPILGSGGTAYRGVLRRNPAAANTATANAASQPMVADVATNGAVGSAVGLETGMMGVVKVEEKEEVATLIVQGTTDEKETSNLANTKEKTPMCLINELARFNKVGHQYTLVDEQGPAHKKTFFVKLKLGEEEYSAQGESIKKAQHAAAAIALNDTKFSHPVPKPPKHVDGQASNITPTVELNALAMKRGEPAVYKLIEPRNQNYAPTNIDFRGMYNQRYHYGRPPRPFYVMLKVGTREFIGDGPTRQAARHSAATKALRVLNNLPMPSESSKPKTEEEEESEDAMKSEISLVHEIALKRNLPVTFEVVRESGPPHMKNFVTKCIVGDMTTEAEGNSKKLSKKRAAEMMLDELKRLPSVPVVVKSKLKSANNKKKNRNIIKVQKADPSYGVGVNPISRLIQIMQAQKKKEPVYTLVAEKGLPRRREFVMQCQVDENTSEGVGPNKKLAKRNAAESMLQLLGFSRPSPQPSKPAIKNTQSSEGAGSSDKKVTFVDTGKASNGVVGDKGDASNSTGCQVVPGLLRLNHAGAASVPGLTISSGPHTYAGGKDNVSSVLSKAGSKAESQAIALAEHLNIHIKFEEFTKSNSAEYLTRVTLSTNPPQMYHGGGPTREMSRDAAAVCTLQPLLALATGPLNAAGDVSGMKQEGGMKTTLPHQLTSAGDQI